MNMCVYRRKDSGLDLTRVPPSCCASSEKFTVFQPKLRRSHLGLKTSSTALSMPSTSSAKVP